ncbi:MAG: protein kinase [Candidatus Berkiella sp.]
MLSSMTGTKPINRFLVHLDQILGEGAEGRVVKAASLNDGLVACKIVKHYTCESISTLKPESINVERERRNLQLVGMLKDQYTEVQEDSVTNYTFMTFHEGIPLLQHLYEIETVNDTPNPHKKYVAKREHKLSHILDLAINIIEIMLEAHDKGLVLRDLKLDNFIINKAQNSNNFSLVFVDYGSALTFEEAIKNRTLDGTTNGYVAPELDVSHKKDMPPYTIMQDYYALGVAIAELLTKENFQEKLLAATKQSQHHNLTAKDIKGLLPDVLQEESLASHRKKSSLSTESSCRNSPRLNNIKKAVHQDLENKVRVHLTELIYKLLAPIRHEIQITPSSSPVRIVANHNYIEWRPTEEELRIQLAFLKQFAHSFLELKTRQDDDNDFAVVQSQSSSTCTQSSDSHQQIGLIESLSTLLSDLSLSGTIIEEHNLKPGQKARLFICKQHLEAARAQPFEAQLHLEGVYKLLEQDPSFNSLLERLTKITPVK